MEETNFFNDQKNLDTMYYLMQGLTYRQVAKRTDKQISYVKQIMDFLRTNGLLYWGRWTVNVYKIGMKKSIAFLNWEDKDVPKKDNYKYTTYVHKAQARNARVIVIYTYLEEDEPEIKGDIGESITPFYYTHTRFTVPFFSKTNLFEEFFDRFNSMDNSKDILIGNPSFEAEKVYDDPVTVYICKHVESLPELTPGILTEKLDQDFGDCKEIEINYDKVRTTLNRMKEKEVIFPKNALNFESLSYQAALVRFKSKEIYRVMRTFNEFNMLTRMALTPNQNIFYLHIQYPFNQFSDVMEILSELDPTHEAYIETKFVFSDVIYYQWALEKFMKSRSEG